MNVDDIPKELELEGVYYGSQLMGYVCDNPNELILTLQNLKFTDPDLNKYKVTAIHKGYIHRGMGLTYHIPGVEQTIYIVNRV